MSDFKQTLNLVRPFYRGLPIIIAIMATMVLLAKKYLNYTTPLYESVSHIKLADSEIGVPHTNLYRDFDVFASTNKIGAEVEMVKSEVVVSKAIKKIDLSYTAYRVGDIHKTELYNDCPFSIIPVTVDAKGYDTKFLMSITKDSLVEIIAPNKQKVTATLNTLVNTSVASFYILRNDSLAKYKSNVHVNDRYEFTLNSTKKLIDELRHKLDVVYLDKEVPILRIAYKTPVAEKSADIVNAVSEAYINDYVEEKYAAADTTVDFLNKEVANYSNKLSSSEGALQSFREKHRVVNLKQEAETGLRSIAELKNRKAGLQMDLLAIDSLDRYIKNGKDFSDLAPNFQTFNDLLSTELLKKIKSLQSDRHDLLIKYTSENDKVKVVDDKLNDLYDYLKESVNNTRENLQIKYNDLNRTIARDEAAFDIYPYKDRSMGVLERNTNMNEQIYRFLHQKKTDAEIAKAAKISFHRIISRGEVPKTPVSPNPGLMKAVAGFLGFLFGIAIIYLVHFLKGRVNNEMNVQKNSDTPVFAKIPFLKNKKIADYTFQKIAVDLQIKNELEKNAVIAINSFGTMEGKCTAANGIANAVEELGKKVLILDVDGKLKNIPNANVDIINLQSGKLKWKQPDTLQMLLKEWKQNYEVILIKNAPIASNPSALLWMSAATTNLMVLDTRLTKLKKVEETDLLKIELGLSNIQFMLNRVGYTPSIFLEAFRILKSISLRKPFIKFHN